MVLIGWFETLVVWALNTFDPGSTVRQLSSARTRRSAGYALAHEKLRNY